MEREVSNLRSELCDSHGEERASMITHAIGTLLSITALVLMIIAAGGDVVRIVSVAVFGTTLVLLYASSTIYHAVSSPRLRSIFQAVDHACIYLLIAGSYTPLTLIALRGPWGWSIFASVWALATFGIVLKSVMRGKRESWWSTALYILMGWLIVMALGPLVRSVSPADFAWLVGGGLCYTLGVIFFAWNRLPYNHAIWHVFVLGGSTCHVIATLGFIPV